MRFRTRSAQRKYDFGILRATIFEVDETNDFVNIIAHLRAKMALR